MDIEIIDYPKKWKEIIYKAGRNCYGLEINKEDIHLRDKDLNHFIYMLIKNKHESVLEHINICIYFKNIPRSIMAQITRHRLCSFSIKSTHYVNHESFNYLDLEPILGNQYTQLMKRIQNLYTFFKENRNVPHYILREILPNSCFTNIFMTTNLREYRLILNQRLTNDNVPLMSELMRQLCRELYLIFPECFFDIVTEFELE